MEKVNDLGSKMTQDGGLESEVVESESREQNNQITGNRNVTMKAKKNLHDSVFYGYLIGVCE